jgi:phospholipid-binding lipoprotein MlaA
MLALAATALLLPTACAHSPAGPQSRAGVDGALIPASQTTATTPPVVVAATPGDPLEAANRTVFGFNMAFDDAVFRPVALGYRQALHPWVRERIRNVVNNAHELRHSGNALLQGEPVAAGTSLMRFVINTTLGLGGMFDLHSIGGPPHQPRDFGQTLHRWGVPAGPYLMLPVLGPSNPRDLVGRVADGFMNPVTWTMPFAGNMARGVVEGVDLRERNIEALDALRADSLDFYARVRSVWQQRRDAELGVTSAEPGGLDVLDDPDAAAPAPGAAVVPQAAPRMAARAPRPAAAAARPALGPTPARAVVRRPAAQPVLAVRPAPRPVVTARPVVKKAPARLAAAAPRSLAR